MRVVFYGELTVSEGFQLPVCSHWRYRVSCYIPGEGLKEVKLGEYCGPYMHIVEA